MPVSEVIVIGGGVEGCSIAYHLAKSGARVTVLEMLQIAAAASGASAGGVRHQGRDEREFPLAFRAIECWRTLEEELGADLSYRRGGHITTIEHEEDLSKLTASVDRQNALGLDIRLVQGDELRLLCPGLSETVIAGVYSPNDGHANPADTTRAFAAAAQRQGVSVRECTAVKRIVVESGRVTGVQTSEGNHAADFTVLAAGAWSKSLASDLGIELPIVAQGFQAMTTEPAPPVLTQVLGSVRRTLSLKQLLDGRYLLGGGWPGEFTLDAPRGRSVLESQTGNRDAAIGVIPAVGTVAIADAWLGIEAVSVDGVPIIGPVPGLDGLITATGFSGHGFALSPALGEAVAELIQTGTVPESIKELTIDRFARSRSRAETLYRAG